MLDRAAVLRSAAVEHPHRCLYCDTLWFCREECPLVGPSVCADCRERIRRTPGTALRVLPLTDRSIIAQLADDEAKRWREAFRRRRDQR